MPNIKDKRIEARIATTFEEIRNATLQFTKDRLQGITQSRIAGMTDETIIKTLGDGWEQSFLNEAARAVWEGAKWVAQQSVYSSLPLANLYQWQYNPGAKHCEKCSELNGQIKSLEEWRAEGLPGSRQEGCYANCCCDLVRVEKTKVESIRKDSVTGKPLNMNVDYANLLKQNYSDVDIIVDGVLEKEHVEELYITLKHIQKEVGKQSLSEVKKLYAGEMPEDFETTGGVYSERRKILGLNMDIINEPRENGVLNLDRTTKIIVAHEIAHSQLFKHNLQEDPEVKSFFTENKDVIIRCFPFLKKCQPDIRHEEFLVDSFSYLLAGKLRTKVPTEVYDFVKRKFEEIKELERIEGQ